MTSQFYLQLRLNIPKLLDSLTVLPSSQGLCTRIHILTHCVWNQARDGEVREMEITIPILVLVMLGQGMWLEQASLSLSSHLVFGKSCLSSGNRLTYPVSLASGKPGQHTPESLHNKNREILVSRAASGPWSSYTSTWKHMQSTMQHTHEKKPETSQRSLSYSSRWGVGRRVELRIGELLCNIYEWIVGFSL